MPERFDFGNLVTRLSDLENWLNSIGLATPDRLRRYRRNIQRMLEAEARGEIEHLQTTMPDEEAREILWSYVEGDELLRALDALRPYEDANLRAQIALALKGPPDLFLEDAGSNLGRNYAFELVVGGRFASAGYWPRYGGQADVEFDFATLHVGVQCKRPLSEKKLERAIRGACRQIDSGTADLGLIAVSLSRLINPGDPHMIPEVMDAEMGFAYLKTRVCEIAESAKRFWLGRTGSSVVGLYLYAFTPIRARREAQCLPFRYDVLFPIRAGGAENELLRLLAQTITAQ